MATEVAGLTCDSAQAVGALRTHAGRNPRGGTPSPEHPGEPRARRGAPEQEIGSAFANLALMIDRADAVNRKSATCVSRPAYRSCASSGGTYDANGAVGVGRFGRFSRLAAKREILYHIVILSII